MAIAEDIRRCVVFIGHGVDAHFKSCGTGFFVLHEETTYLVTARHIAIGCGDDPFGVRVNQIAGGSRIIHIDFGIGGQSMPQWYFPDDPTVDLAIMPFDQLLNHSTDLIRSLGGPHWAIERVNSKDQVGPASVCHAIGLFKIVQGNIRNVPIVHTGAIAMHCDDERVPVEDWNDKSKSVYVRGHLVELTNLEGLSGAPVLVRPDIAINGFKTDLGIDVSVSALENRLFLLGVWQGSWNHHIHDGRRPLAIGVVVPAEDLQALLAQADVVLARAVAKGEREHRKAATLD